MITYPSDVQLVREIERFNNRKLKGKSSASSTDGVVTIMSTQYDDDEDEFTEVPSLKVSRESIRNARDRFTSYATLLQAFLDETKIP